MMVNTLHNKLRTIPHLPFPIFFDHDKIKKEIETAPIQGEPDADEESAILEALKERKLLKKLNKKLEGK